MNKARVAVRWVKSVSAKSVSELNNLLKINMIQDKYLTYLFFLLEFSYASSFKNPSAGFNLSCLKPR